MSQTSTAYLFIFGLCTLYQLSCQPGTNRAAAGGKKRLPRNDQPTIYLEVIPKEVRFKVFYKSDILRI